jgi:hypothetical protein
MCTSAKAQLFVVSSEVTSDLLMAPSLGLEIVTGNRSSVSVNALISNGLLGKDFKLTAFQPEYRYWFSGRPINKWFVGVGAVGALFDVRRKGKVYDGYGFGAGITYGYVWNITERLSIDFHSGFGIFYYTRKEYFEQDNYDVDYTENGIQRANATGYYLLPTRVGVSVSYILK